MSQVESEPTTEEGPDGSSTGDGLDGSSTGDGPDGSSIAGVPGGAARTADESEIPREEIFTVLSNRRRRRVLHYLEAHDGDRVDLRTLVDVLSEWECGEPAEQLSWRERKRVYTALRQSHLPKLAEAGAIEYDRSRGEVTLTEETREFQVYLEYVPKGDVPWSLCYLGLTAVGGTVAGLAWLSVFPFGGLSGFAVSAVLLATFAVSAVAHTYHSRRNRLGVPGAVP